MKKRFSLNEDICGFLICIGLLIFVLYLVSLFK